MYRIKIYRNNGQRDILVTIPAQTFDSFTDIEAFMEEKYPDCWYSADFASRVK